MKRLNMSDYSVNFQNMPPPGLASKSAFKIDVSIREYDSSRRLTNPNNVPIKPRKTLRKFTKGSMNRQLLTKNFTIEIQVV